MSTQNAKGGAASGMAVAAGTVATAAACGMVYFCSQAGDPGAHHAPAHAKEAKQPVDPNGAAAGADVNASGVAAGGSGAASSPDSAASTASVTAARVGAEQASTAAADDLEVVVTEPIKGGGADKVLTPPSEPAVPSADTSADAAAIEAAIIAASDALEPLSHRIREARANPFRDPERAHDSETIEEIAAACRKAGREWKDPSFGHADEEVFKNWPVGLDKSAVSWEPPSRYCSTRRPVGKNKHGKRTWLYCDFNGDGVATAAESMKGSEIEQGLLGDCYLLCALATAVKDLQVADDLIDETYEDAGIYGVTFWADGRWRMVWVDAYVPCTSKELSLGSDRMMNGRSMNSTGRGRAVKRFRPLFAKMKDTKEIWTLLVEKAYAKYKGGYEAIVGGHPGEALSLITGGTTGYTLLANQSIGAQQAMLLPRPTADFVWLTLSSKLRASDCFVGAGSVRPSARNQEAQEKFLKGVVPGHAYTVMDVMELPEVVHSDEEQEAADDEEEEAEEGADGAASKEPQMKQIIKLRNPWGHGEWEGKWSDRSEVWHTPTGRAMAKALGDRRGENEDDGAFWMELQDFTLRFATLEWCQTVKTQEEKQQARRLAIETDGLPDDDADSGSVDSDGKDAAAAASPGGLKSPKRSPKKGKSKRKGGKKRR